MIWDKPCARWVHILLYWINCAGLNPTNAELNEYQKEVDGDSIEFTEVSLSNVHTVDRSLVFGHDDQTNEERRH